MAKRLWLPALRGGQPTQEIALESKSIAWGGSGITPAHTGYGYGTRDYAAGWDLDRVVSEGYERVPWVYIAIEIIAGHASRLPFQITSGEDKVLNHPLVRVMNKRANPHENARAFRKRLSAQVLLSKRGAFVEVTKSRAGHIVRLDLLPPDRVVVVPDQTGDYVDYFEFTRYDGVVRQLSPEKVRWIRDPHPLDPFSGVTPLEAAGLSIELDHLARQYNVSFINKDGRPGGILGVDTDELDDAELDRIERKLAPGPYNAGQIAAIGTGPGGIRYVDTAAKPRDMAYETTSEKAKREILAAFKIPESMAADAGGRTFDNAEQEAFNFWNDPMLPHLDLIASAFDDDVAADLDCGYDTSSVEALELPMRRRREEARREVNDGLRSIDEYRPMAGLEPLDNAQTRALWVSPAKAPVPGKPGDEAALGLGDPNAAMMGGGVPGALPPGPDSGMPPEGGAPAPTDPAAPAADAVTDALTETPEEAVAADAVVASPDGEMDPAAQAVADAQSLTPFDVEGGPAAEAVAEAEALLEGKSLEAAHPSLPTTDGEYAPGEDEARRVELAVAAALDAMLARQAGVIAARLESPKTRRHTRYWQPENELDTRVGEDPIDTSKVVDQARWAGELQATLEPIVGPAAQEAASGLLTALAASGALYVAAESAAVVVGRISDGVAASAEQIALAAAQAAIAPTVLALAIAQEALEEWLDKRADEMTRLMVEENAELATVVDSVTKQWADKGRTFADALAVTVAQTAVGGGREAAAEHVLTEVPHPDAPFDAIPVVLRKWVCRQDERVRASHKDAHGQLREVGQPFMIGGFPLRYPSDPLAPPKESRWCRCWLRYSWPADARFTLPAPAGLAAAA